MAPNGIGTGPDPRWLSGYIESRMIAAAHEYPVNLDTAQLPEWNSYDTHAALNQWYIGELFDICSARGVEPSRCSTVNGPLHIAQTSVPDGAIIELRSSFAYSGYAGLHQIRIRDGEQWPFLSIETSSERPMEGVTSNQLFEIGHGRIDAVEKFIELNGRNLSAPVLSEVLCGLDPELRSGTLPQALRISGISESKSTGGRDLISFEWLLNGEQGTVESVVMTAPEGRLLRRGGVLHLGELPTIPVAQLVGDIIETVLGRDSDEILQLPLRIKKAG